MGVTSYLTVNGKILSESRSGVESDYIPDPQGSTSALINSSQTITDTFTWWPYGEERSHLGSSVTPFGYQGTLGYYADGDSGRVYVQTRVFAPSNTLWLTVDSLWPFERPYGYADQNPVTKSDPTGKGGCPPQFEVLCKMTCRYAMRLIWEHWNWDCSILQHRVCTLSGVTYGYVYSNYTCICTGKVLRSKPIRNPDCKVLCTLLCGIVGVLGVKGSLPPPLDSLDFGPGNCEGVCEHGARKAGLCD